MAAAKRPSAHMGAVASFFMLVTLMLLQHVAPSAATVLPHTGLHPAVSAVGNRPPMDPRLVQNIQVKLLKPATSTSPTPPIPAVINLGVDPSTGEPLKPAPTKSGATAAGARSKPQAKLPRPQFGAKPPVVKTKPAVANHNLQPPSAALKGLLNLFTSTKN